MREDQLRRFLGNHDRRPIGVAADQAGHDRGINHPQSLYAPHTQRRVDHGLLVNTHLAGTDRVVVRSRQASRLRVRVDVGVARAFRTRLDFGTAKRVERFLGMQLARLAEGKTVQVTIPCIGQIVVHDVWSIERIRRAKRDAPPRAGVAEGPSERGRVENWRAYVRVRWQCPSLSLRASVRLP